MFDRRQIGRRQSLIEEAKAVCNLDDGCKAVYDDLCDGGELEEIYLCRMGAVYEDSYSYSCIYEKKGKI